MQTRRKFLGDCSVLAAAACLAPATVMTAKPAASGQVLVLPGYTEFLAQVNTPFTPPGSSLATPLVLVSVTPLPAARTDPAVAGNESFCLRFRGPAQPRLAQDTYALAHPRFGALEIFLVPVGRPAATAGHYEAIFDRPVNPDLLARQIMRAPRSIQIT